MYKLSVFLFTLFLVAAIYGPCAAETPAAPIKQSTNDNSKLSPIKLIPIVRGEGWKTAERFDISNIDGLQELYTAEAQIVLYATGMSDKMEVEESNGFAVVGLIFDRSQKAGHHAAKVGNRAEVEYDPGRRAWQVKFTAPNVSGENYAVVVDLYCGVKDSPCASTYGLGTQVSRIVPFQVR